jgi:diguanylate cyclase (GGDEF)-like protein
MLHSIEPNPIADAPRPGAEEGLLVLSPIDLRVVAANETARELIGATEGRSLVGKAVSDLLPDVAVVLQDRPPSLVSPDNPPRSALQIAFTSSLPIGRIVVAMHRLADGDEGLWLVRLAPEELSRANAAAGRDPLTGLATRVELDRYLARRCHAQSDQPFALVFIDLDGFKAVNDAEGHLAGDRVLAAAAERLLAAVRPEDIVVRFGGDEFVVLLTGVRTKRAGDAVIRRMRSSLAETIPASFGLALHPGGAGDPLALLAAADRAMYRDKSARAVGRAVSPSGVSRQSRTG